MRITLTLIALMTLGLLSLQIVAQEAEDSAPLPALEDPLTPCLQLLTNLGAQEQACRRLATTPNEPLAARAHSLLGMHALKRNDLTIARDHAEAAIGLAPADGVVQSNYASLLLREGQYADALAVYERALEDTMLSRADIAAVHLNRALCLRALGRYDAAKDAFLAHESWLSGDVQY